MRFGLVAIYVEIARGGRQLNFATFHIFGKEHLTA